MADVAPPPPPPPGPPGPPGPPPPPGPGDVPAGFQRNLSASDKFKRSIISRLLTGETPLEQAHRIVALGVHPHPFSAIYRAALALMERRYGDVYESLRGYERFKGDDFVLAQVLTQTATNCIEVDNQVRSILLPMNPLLMPPLPMPPLPVPPLPMPPLPVFPESTAQEPPREVVWVPPFGVPPPNPAPFPRYPRPSLAGSSSSDPKPGGPVVARKSQHHRKWESPIYIPLKHFFKQRWGNITNAECRELAAQFGIDWMELRTYFRRKCSSLRRQIKKKEEKK
ncbi:unnamed protein product [Caenorhabditis sp. 36 PRJEB53466]|nr:unnamed protein product [Caenorhabditis sp. 36 PRJEB53466]